MYSLYTITGQTGKIYVGQTKKFPATKRWGYHIRSARNQNNNWHLANAIRKYGSKFFSFSVIGEVQSKEEADNAERLYILLFKSYDPKYGYNSTFGGEGFVFTEEVKQKLRRVLKEVTPTGEDHWWFGKKHTSDSIKRMSIAQKTRYKTKGPTNFRSDVTDKQIVEEYLDCKNYSEVSRRLGLSYSCVYQRYHKAKLDKEILIRNLPRGTEHYAYKNVSIDDIIKEYRDCKSFCEVGRRLGISEGVVRDRYYASGEQKLLNEHEGYGENRKSYRKDLTPELVAKEYAVCGSMNAVAKKFKTSWLVIRDRYQKYLALQKVK